MNDNELEFILNVTPGLSQDMSVNTESEYSIGISMVNEQPIQLDLGTEVELLL